MDKYIKGAAEMKALEKLKEVDCTKVLETIFDAAARGEGSVRLYSYTGVNDLQMRALRHIYFYDVAEYQDYFRVSWMKD